MLKNPFAAPCATASRQPPEMPETNPAAEAGGRGAPGRGERRGRARATAPCCRSSRRDRAGSGIAAPPGGSACSPGGPGPRRRKLPAMPCWSPTSWTPVRTGPTPVPVTSWRACTIGCEGRAARGGARHDLEGVDADVEQLCGVVVAGGVHAAVYARLDEPLVRRECVSAGRVVVDERRQVRRGGGGERCRRAEGGQCGEARDEVLRKRLHAETLRNDTPKRICRSVRPL